jgi:hypothetical protein
VVEDDLSRRKSLTFEQAEGAEPLPTQLKLTELSKGLRARLWAVLYRDISSSVDDGRFVGEWEEILADKHVYRDGRAIDEYHRIAGTAALVLEEIKSVILVGDYVKVFGLLQWILRHRACPHFLSEELNGELNAAGAAYRIYDGDTITPIASEAEAQSVARAFEDLAMSEFHGARAHLKNAATHLTGGEFSASVRESIHAVESVARQLEPTGEFSKALSKLEKSAKIHGAMRAGFGSLYGYTSDEKGIRHPLLDDATAKVDEADALFMIGACAAFVSYLINKGRISGLLSS